MTGTGGGAFHYRALVLFQVGRGHGDNALDKETAGTLWMRKPLCARMDETVPTPEITVEGETG